MKSIATTFFLFLAFLGYSQTKEKPKAEEKVHTINLQIPAEKLATNFSCGEVIDNRLIKENIGFVKKGLNNRATKAVLAGPFESSMKDYVNACFPFLPENEIVMIFHEFTVSEMTKAVSEIGICTMDIEFARKQDGQYYSLGYYFSEIESKGMDVTNGHSYRIEKALKDCIQQFIKSDWKKNEGELIDPSGNVAAYDYKKLPAKGLYTSFNNLATNSALPNFAFRFYKLNEHSKVQSYVYKTIDKEYRKKRVKFIVDSEHVYINASSYTFGKYFLKSKHLGKYIYFEDKLSSTGAAIAFGAVGAMASNTWKPIILDTSTGKIEILTSKVVRRIAKDYPDLLSTYEVSEERIEDKEQLILKLNEKFN